MKFCYKIFSLFVAEQRLESLVWNYSWLYVENLLVVMIQYT